jgi:hypothetical protein
VLFLRPVPPGDAEGNRYAKAYPRVDERLEVPGRCSWRLRDTAAAAAKKQKPVAPQAADSSLCRGANLFHCGPIYNSTDYLGTDPDPFIRAMIQRDLGPKYGGPE